MMSTMFRAKALKRVSSPEQLDRVVRAALPLQWLAMVALLAVVGAVVAWSAIATVPTTLPGTGDYVPLGGPSTVETDTAGIVKLLPTFRVGAQVSAGQVVALITAPTTLGSRPSAAQSVDVRSPSTGTVVQVNDLSGTYLSAGQSVGVVEPAGKPLVVYAYLPTEAASALAPGLPVQITFGAGIGATFGYVRGTVASVSRYPVSIEHVVAVFGNTAAADQVSKLGPAKEVVITLVHSPHTKSGLVWASGGGPPGQLPPGLPVSVKFVLGSHHPISDVL